LLDKVVQNYYKISAKLPAVSLSIQFSTELKVSYRFWAPK